MKWTAQQITGMMMEKPKRTKCGCEKCRHGCVVLPAYLIPADLLGYMEKTGGPHDNPDNLYLLHDWAEKNLVASEGTLIEVEGERMRVPTLVPSSKEDGSCIHYVDGRCKVHANSPAGCAYFNACALGKKAKKQEELALTLAWCLAYMWAEQANDPDGDLYRNLWGYLWDKGIQRTKEEVNKRREKYYGRKEIQN